MIKTKQTKTQDTRDTVLSSKMFFDNEVDQQRREQRGFKMTLGTLLMTVQDTAKDCEGKKEMLQCWR